MMNAHTPRPSALRRDNGARPPRLGPPLIAAALLAGCTTPPGLFSSGTRPPGTDPAMMAAAASQVVEESRALTQAVDSTREQLQQRPERKVSLPLVIAPEPDPLEDRLVSVDMYDARADQFLWALAKDLGFNLVIDPKVLKLSQRASLYLSQVSAREALNAILQMFDLHATQTGGSMHVTLTDQRVFPADMLGGRVAMNLNSGGDVLGGSEKESQQTMRGGVRVTADTGVKEDGFETLLKSVEAIVADGANRTSDEELTRPVVSLDRRSQSLFVRARPSRLRQVAEFLAQANLVRNRQVQIDVQVLDVTLKQDYRFGIDWSLLGKKVAGVAGNPTLTMQPINDATLPNASGSLPTRGVLIGGSSPAAVAGGLGLAATADSVSAVLNALRTYGTVKVVSNPTVRARSGEPSVVQVGTNYRFVSKMSATTTTAQGMTNTSVDAETSNLFSGIVLGLTASVRRDGSIELFVHPMQSSLRPGTLALVPVGGGASVTLPVIDSKSITTTLAVNSGDIVVLGGLADQSTSLDNKGVPVLGDAPVVGNLFDQRANGQTSRELVIVMKATLL